MTLRLTIEIVPYGDEDKKRTIDVFNISNLGPSGVRGLTEYAIEENEYHKITDETVKVLHNRRYGALELAVKALNAIKRKRKGKNPNQNFNRWKD